MKTTATTEAVSSPPEENEHWNTKWRRTTSCAGKKPAADLKKDLHNLEAGRKSRKEPTPFVGIKPNGKCQMNKKTFILVASFCGMFAQIDSALAQGTAFTYQGLLQSSGSPANGSYDFTFALYNASSGGTQTGTTQMSAAVPVTNGLFTVIEDFGAGVFDGTTYWLQIGVRTTGTGVFNTLGPREEVTPTPYAISAENVTGSIALSQLPASVSSVTEPGTQNFFAGANSGNSSLSGQGNCGVGDYALSAVTSGLYNTAMGIGALGLDTTGSYNSAFGNDAMAFNSTGSSNTAVGAIALSLTAAGSYNTAIGTGALAFSAGGGNTGVGCSALQNNHTGYNNEGLGFLALAANMSGADNVAVGQSSLLVSLTGSANTGVGTYSFQKMTAGNGNIALGFEAGVNLQTGTNNIYIGNSGNASENGIIRIGTPGTHTATYIAGTAYCQILGITSDRNAKENFATVNPREVLDKVTALPVTEWNYKTDPKENQHIGPMAQDFAAAFRLNGGDDKHISMADEGGVALAAIQGLNQKLENENAQLKQQNDTLARRLDELERALKGLTNKK